VSAIVNASFAGCFGAIIVGQGLQLLAQLKDAPRGDTPRVSMTDEPPPQWRLDCDPRFAVLSEKDHAPCKDAAGRILRRSTYMPRLFRNLRERRDGRLARKAAVARCGRATVRLPILRRSELIECASVKSALCQ
jgi:hypothetical protein